MRIEPCAKGVDLLCIPICSIQNIVYIKHECIMKKDFVDINDITFYY